MIIVNTTFTALPIEPYFRHLIELVGLPDKLYFSPYNQILQQLFDQQSPTLTNLGGINIFLVRIEDWIDIKINTNTSLTIESCPQLKEFLNAFELLLKQKAIHNFIIICKPSPSKLNDVALIELHQQFKEQLDYLLTLYAPSKIFLWHEIEQSYPVMDYYNEFTERTAHIPYTKNYFAALTLFLVRQIYSVRSKPHKVIIVDCDNTLWTGVCGEASINELIIDKPRRFLQQWLITQAEKGRLICLASKNNEADVWEVFEKHSDMLLKREHITSYRINWESKPKNIKEITLELELGLESVIFIDDNPQECAQVNSEYPEVLSVQLPIDLDKIPNLLANLWAADFIQITNEDKLRKQFYQQQVQRKQLASNSCSLKEFIENLKLQLEFRAVTDESIARVAQLTQRTNQFNTLPIRYSESELQHYLSNGSHLLTVNASDKFGDYGLVGAIFYSLSVSTGTLFINGFWLSCRALGKGIEHKIVNYLGNIAEKQCCSKIVFLFQETEKNIPAKEFLNNIAQETTASSEQKSFQITTESAQALQYSTYEKNINIHEGKRSIDNSLQTRNRALIELANALQTADCLVEFAEHRIDKQNRKTIEGYAKAKTAWEIRLCDIWENILQINGIGIDDNFFDLSGESLKAVFIAAQIWDLYQIEINISLLFQYPTIRELARHLELSRSRDAAIIPKLSSGERYKQQLSYAQERLWFLDKFEPNSSQYNMFAAYEVKGVLDEFKLESALQYLIARHESLRTVFVETEDGFPTQKVYPYESHLFKLHRINAQALTKQEIDKIIYEFAQRPFDLSCPPLFRVLLLQKELNVHLLAFSFHHIIFDGWSYNIFTKELSDYFNHSVNSSYNGNDLIQYIDFTIWQRQYLSGAYLEDFLSYWKIKLDDLPEMDLNRLRTDPKALSKIGKRISFSINKKITQALKKLTKSNETTLFNTLITTFALLVSQYLSQDDFAIGTPVYGRNHPSLGNTFGFFVNLLAIRFKLDSNLNFNQLLRNTHAALKEDFARQDAPFEKVVAKCCSSRNSNTNPLAELLFVYQNHFKNDLSLQDLDLAPYANIRHDLLLADFDSAKFDLTVFMQEIDYSLEGLVEFNTGSFEVNIIEGFVSNFCILLENVVLHAKSPIFSIPFSSPTYKKMLLHSSKPIDTTVIDLFTQQANQHFECVAVRYRNTKLTYGELLQQSAALANAIGEFTKNPQKVIGVFVERNSLMILAMLGIMRGANVYLPIDINYPPARIRLILQHAKPDLIIIQNSLFSKIKDIINELAFTPQCLLLEENSNLLLSNSLTSKKCVLPKPTDLAYITYTSGTTGKPKGIAIEHATLSNLVNWQNKQIRKASKRHITQYASPSFDVALQEIFYTLCHGQELHIIPEEAKYLPSLFLNYIEQNHINTIFIPTVVLNFLASEAIENIYRLSHLKQIIVAGEQLKITHDIRLFFERYKKINLVNQYGPAESHVVTSYCMNYNTIKKDKFPPIGYLIDNVEIFILNKFMQLVPESVVGEIYIGGISLAREYYNNEELTHERFIELEINNTIQRLYKTGDLGYRVKNLFYYFGREDKQVKISGYRIELSEIEEVLNRHPVVEQAVVLPIEKPTRYLAVGIVPKDKQADEDFSFLTVYLKEYLPTYMIPRKYIKLLSLPLTAHGKVDKKVLEHLFSQDLETSLIQKEITPVQHELIGIFASTLNINSNDIGIDASFFSLGGHSLLAVKLIKHIELTFNLQLKVKTIFENTTIRELSKVIESQHFTAANNNITEASEFLFKIKEGDENTFVFFLHPVSGELLCYTHLLAHLECPYTLYGVEFAHHVNFKSLRELAKFYLERIIDITKHQRAVLIGYSLGGLLAYEISKQYQLTHKKEMPIILIDTVFPAEAKLKAPKANQIETTYENVVITDMEHWSGLMKDNKDKLYGLYTNYKTTIPMTLSAVILTAAEGQYGKDIKLIEQLHKYFSRLPIREILPGNHLDMLDDVHAPHLAHRLAECLEKLLKEHTVI